MNDNVVPFPLRGRKLMAEVAKVVKAAGRRLHASEVAEAVGESFEVVYDALDATSVPWRGEVLQTRRAARMTKYDDRECIRGAAYDEAELRKQCREGTERYLQALIAAGYLPAPRKAA